MKAYLKVSSPTGDLITVTKLQMLLGTYWPGSGLVVGTQC